MKQFVMLVSALLLAGAACAGDVTDSSLNYRIMIQNRCDTGDCDTMVRLNIVTDLKANLSPTEVLNLGPDTVIRGNFPLGPTASFELNDDPAFVPGSTGVKIHETTTYNGIPWEKKITMDWKDNELRLKATITANAKLSDFEHTPYEDLIKTRTKLKEPSTVRVQLVGENSGADFLTLDGPSIPVYLKVQDSTKSLKDGSIKLKSNQSVQGRKDVL